MGLFHYQQISVFTLCSAHRTLTRNLASNSNLAITSALLDIYSSSSKTIDALMKLELPSGVEVEIKV